MPVNNECSYKKREGTSGMGGQLYEIQLCILLMLRGTENKKISNFWLASNMKQAASFDDVVFKYEYKDECNLDKSKIIFLQSKHHESGQKKITADTLLSPISKGDFALRKYLNSFSRIKFLFSQSNNHPIFNSSIDDCEFIIYTNVQFCDDKCKEHVIKRIVETDHILNIQSKESHCYYQLLDTDKIIEELKPSVDHEILVCELSKVISNKCLDMNKVIFNDYHFQLNENVIKRINKKQGMFRKEFIHNEAFINSIFEVIKNKIEPIKTVSDLKKYLEDLVINVPDKFGSDIEDSFQCPLPCKHFEGEEIKLFLSKLKLFTSQPNERHLGQIIQNELHSIYHQELHVNAVFSDVKEKIQNWWRDGVQYLTKENNFFQESTKVWFGFCFDVRAPTELFTGREEELKELHNKISLGQEMATVISQMTSISGLGGIGKTELTRKYIHQFSDYYHNNVIWINAENKETLTEGFVKLAEEKLNITTKSSNGKRKRTETIVDEVYQFFSKRKCLFVFDNAINCEDFIQFLPLKSLKPSDQKPFILVTSRDRECGGIVETVDLFVLSVKDAINLVKKGLSIEHSIHDEEIEEFVTKLQCFPLAIRQAIAYINNENVIGRYNIFNYLREYEKNTKNLLKSQAIQTVTSDYIKTTFTTWKITIKKIRRDKYGRLALDILSIMAYIAPDNIKRDMFLCLSEDTDQIVSAVRVLVKYSMINGEHHQSVLNIHRLVQEVIRIEINDQNQQKRFMEKTFNLFKCIEPSEFHVNLLMHMEVFLIHTENWTPQQRNHSRCNIHFLGLINFLNNKTHVKLKNEYLITLFKWLDVGYLNINYVRRTVILEKFLEYQKTQNPCSTKDILHIISDLSNCYALSNHQKHTELLEEALDILEKEFGSESDKLIYPLTRLSNAYTESGDEVKGKDILRRALKISEKYDRQKYLYNKYKLGRHTVDANLEERLEFEELLEKYLTRMEQQQHLTSSSEDDTDWEFVTDIFIEDFIFTHKDLDIQKSTELLNRALKYKEKQCSVVTAQSHLQVNHLVRTYENLGEPQKKKKFLERVIKIYEHYSSNDPLEERARLIALAKAYEEFQEYKKQVECLEAASKIQEKKGRTLLSLANAYTLLNNFQKAKEILEHVLKIEEEFYGSDDLKINYIVSQLADVYGKLGDRTKQIELLERSLRLYENCYGPNNHNLLSSLNKLAKVYRSLEDHQKVQQLLQRSLKLTEDRYGRESANVIDILLDLGDAFESLKEFDQQKYLIERVAIVVERVDSRDGFNKMEVLERVCKAYKNLGNYDKEKELLQKILIKKGLRSSADDFGQDIV